MSFLSPNTKSTVTAITWVLAVALFAGCERSTGDGGGGPGGPAGAGGQPTYQRDVRPILAARCEGCHREGGIGPFPLGSFENAHAMRAAIKAAVVTREMPPWFAAEGCNTYADDISLTQEQIDVISRWADGESAEGDPSQFAPLSVPPPRTLSRVDQTFTLPEPYVSKTSPDDYRCFLLDWTPATDIFLTGFGVEPDNEEILHHLILFAADVDRVADFQQLDEADPGPGYTCFGGPGSPTGGVTGYSGTHVVGAWAPGVPPADFVAGAGMRLAAGTRLIVQTHYNTSHAAATPDQPKIQVKLDRQVSTVAYSMPFSKPLWILFPRTMLIPAGNPDVVHTVEQSADVFLSRSETMDPQKPVLLHAVQYHQHLLGTRGRVDLIRADGSRECLLNLRRWDFHWQNGYTFQTPKVMNPGDQLRLECHWDNSAENQPVHDGHRSAPKDVTFGEGTEDEMCVAGFFTTQ